MPRWPFLRSPVPAVDAPAIPEAASILRRARRLRFRVRPDTAAAIAGAYHSARPGIGLTFSELRAYEPGDDVRYLDWNVTARQGRPYVRRFVEERALTLWVAIDVSASMRFGPESRTKADRAAQCAALLAAAAIQSGDRVGLMLVTDTIEFELRPQGGVRQLSRMLRALIATTTASSRTRLGVVLPRMRRVRRRSLVVVLSDFAELDSPSAWRAISARHDVVAARVVDPREQTLPEVGLLAVEDPETHQRHTIDTGSRAVRAAYAENARRRDQQFARWCLEASVDPLTLSTDEEPMGPVLRFLNSRSRAHGVVGRR